MQAAVQPHALPLSGQSEDKADDDEEQHHRHQDDERQVLAEQSLREAGVPAGRGRAEEEGMRSRAEPANPTWPDRPRQIQPRQHAKPAVSGAAPHLVVQVFCLDRKLLGVLAQHVGHLSHAWRPTSEARGEHASGGSMGGAKRA